MVHFVLTWNFYSLNNFTKLGEGSLEEEHVLDVDLLTEPVGDGDFSVGVYASEGVGEHAGDLLGLVDLDGVGPEREGVVEAHAVELLSVGVAGDAEAGEAPCPWDHAACSSGRGSGSGSGRGSGSGIGRGIEKATVDRGLVKLGRGAGDTEESGE